MSDLRDACAGAVAVGGDGGNSEMSKIEKILQKRDLTEENFTAHGFLLDLPAIERIDRLALAADQRGNALLREIKRKRASFAQQLRTATADILDVDHAETR